MSAGDHVPTTPAKVTAPMRRVLAAIAAGAPWRAAHETVEAILVAGLASYDDNGWRTTAPVGAPKARRHAPDRLVRSPPRRTGCDSGKHAAHGGGDFCGGGSSGGWHGL